jgi:hypothetical protein
VIDTQAIEKAKHIAVIVDEKSFAHGSAIYSYLLQLHKKVTLVSEVPLAKKLSCLAWYKDVRNALPQGAEYVLKVECEALELYHYLQNCGAKINEKIAQALYVALFMERNLFAPSLEQERVAVASQLLEVACEAPACFNQVVRTRSLAELRLKAKLLQRAVLRADATQAWVEICEDDFKQTATQHKDIMVCVEDLFCLPYVQEVIFTDSQTKQKIKTVIKEDFEKKK